MNNDQIEKPSLEAYTNEELISEVVRRVLPDVVKNFFEKEGCLTKAIENQTKSALREIENIEFLSNCLDASDANYYIDASNRYDELLRENKL